MMDRMLALTVAVLLASSAAGQPLEKGEPCPVLLTTLAPQLMFRHPLNRLRRVELRSCRPGASENLQLVAWEDRSDKPSLVLETADSTVIQLFMRGSVFVIETARDAYDTLMVIVYEKGRPRIALQQTVRDPATIAVSGDEVKITLRENQGPTRSYTYTIGGD